MTLTIERYGRGWSVDCKELSGSPQMGTGRTKFAAMACFFIRNRDELALLPKTVQDVLIINGKLWRDMPGSKR